MAETQIGASIESAFAAVVAGDYPGAIGIYRQLLQKSPRDGMLHNSLGQLLLTTGEFAAGWEECEWRPQRKFDMPRWRGAPLAGERVLVHGEQGFGDNFQFVRYASLVAARGGTVVAATRAGLRPLIATVPGVSDVIESGEVIGTLNYHVPMLSLPYIFATRLETIPADVPYLTADAARVGRWRERFAATPGLHVGIIWSGNTDAVYNARRSPGLAALRPLFDFPGITFYALQKGGGRADLDGFQCPASLIDLDSDLADFSDTAAAMTALDLVISPCTSTAHLAGALGRPVWVMLGVDPDWRWMLDRDTSPWYPTARLFRRPYGGDWSDPVMRMRSALEDLVRQVQS